ncbi:MAG: energy transducer TonB [Nitrospira sp.]|nr:energy transducer TonB [Nitrospira sp.]
MTDASGVNGTTPQLTPKDVHIEVSADSLFGSLPINRGLTVSVEIPESPVRRGERLVAVFETPTSAPYTVPLEIDHARHHYAATVDLGRLSGTLGTPPKATTLQILIGRQQDLHVEPLVERTVIVTIAIPGYADHRSSPADLSAHLTDDSERGRRPTDLAVLDGRLEEEELLENGRLPRQEGYWKMLQRLIGKRMLDERPTRRNGEVGHMPGIGFRLYANGEAQLIEVERSSGDRELDQAAVLAVVNAHPFPPFPPGTRDTQVEVHVDIPALSR